ncbi:MAG TPA: tetratricopeptide repeat protein [Bryobacteraceae bacterium]|nr:tetratricopeptide repeat protein [Bryobacteraceae bacterium]
MPWNISPSTEEVHFLMESGFLYRDLGKFDEARDVFNGVRAMLPSSEVPEVALGTVTFQRGDFDGAARHYNRAVHLNPRSAFAHAHLGELSIFKKDKDSAREHLKTAVELDPRGEFGKMARGLLEFVDVVRFE